MWRVQDTTAELQLATCTGQVDLLRPALNLTCCGRLRWDEGQPSLFQVQQCVVGGGVSLRDAYVRGSDLVATYTLPDEVVAQLYFRAFDDEDTSVGTIELIASLNCNAGVRHPGFLVRSLAEQTPIQAGDRFALWNLGERLSYVEMSHPGNGEAAPSDSFAHRLFFDELEKGVIRRAHLRGLLWPQSGERAATHLAQWQAEFSACELPLTT